MLALVRAPNPLHRTGLRLYLAAWLVFFVAAWLIRGVPLRAAAAMILIGGAGLGLAAASAPARTSDDQFRYVWDGTVQAAGIDPYSYVPAAPQLAGLRNNFLWPGHRTTWCVGTSTNPDGPGLLTPGCTLINRPTVHTIYPPVAQAYFYAVHELAPDGRYQQIQLAAVATATATTAVLLVGLRRLGRDPRQAALWAWCPLVAYETGNGAHVDVLGALLSISALIVLAGSAERAFGAPDAGRARRRAQLAGGVLLGLAVAAKFTPVCALPGAVRRRSLTVGAGLTAAVAAVYLPHVIAVGPKVIGFIPGYIRDQGYASGGGYLLLGNVLPGKAADVAALAVVAATGIAVHARARQRTPWRGAVVMTGVALLVTTPPYPWYAMLLCAFVALDGRVEWLAVAMAGLVGRHLGEGYALAAAVVVVATVLRHRAAVAAGSGTVAAAVAAAAACTQTPGSAGSAEPDAPAPTDTGREILVEVILPCLDESGALPYVLGRLPEGYRAIVVDNGSTDGSADLARRLGATVVHEPRRGFGAACHAGLAAATAPVVCFCDCDGSLDPAQAHRDADPLVQGRADLVLGRRLAATAGAWPPHARAANTVLAFRLRRRGIRVHDLGPLRAARRDALLGLELADRRSGYPLEMVLKAGNAGWRITEADVDYVPRTGRSKVTGTVSGTLKAVRDMSRVWREAVREAAR